MLCGGYLLVAAKVAISIFVNQLNATNLKSSKTQFQFQFELSLAQLSPSLFISESFSPLKFGLTLKTASERF